jgi:hypothetical protein
LEVVFILLEHLPPSRRIFIGPQSLPPPLSGSPYRSFTNQQGKKLAENKFSTPRTAGKKSLEKPSAISKLQEEKLAKNKSSTPPTVGKQALKKPSSAISKQQEKEIAINKTFNRPTRKQSKRNTKENPWYMTNPKRSERNTEKIILGLWLTQITNSERAFSVMVISKRLLLIPESSTHSTCNVVSQMIVLTLLMVKFRQPSHEFTFSVDMSFILYPLVLTPLV